MGYCPNCGQSVEDGALFCPKCGKSLSSVPSNNSVNTNKRTSLQSVAFVFMVINTIFLGFAIIPLFWCIPMTISYANKTRNGIEVSIGFKVCILLFVSLISGICALVDDN